MGRGDGFLRLLSLILVLALAAYLGLGALGALDRGLRTVKAEPATVTLGGVARGIIIRDELLLQSEGEISAFFAQEGKRVGVGDAVAAGLFARSAGLFSAAADGFEFLSPEVLSSLSAARLSEIMESEGENSENAVGKIVRGTDWYFAAFTGEALHTGQKVTLDFGFAVEAEVLRLRGDMVIFRMDSHLADSLSLRKGEAEIISAQYSGLRIPAAALRRNAEGETYVTVLTATLPEDKKVNIIHDGGPWLLAELEGRADALRPGNLIVVGP